MRRAGFHAVTLAGNHIADCGAEGIADTVAALDAAGIAHCGAGANLEAARRPCHRRSRRHAASRCSATTAWVRRNRGPRRRAPAAPSCASTRRMDRASLRARRCSTPNAESLARCCAPTFARARADAQLVIVALHKGIVHTPAVLAPYERAVAHAAIDAGADVVVGHHAHILRGIEIHRGKPIFHGLGNGCVVTRALSPDTDDPGARRLGTTPPRDVRLHAGSGVLPRAVPSPGRERDAGMRARCRPTARCRAGFVPVHVEPPGRPRLCSDAEARDVVRYVEEITVAAGLAPLAIDIPGRDRMDPVNPPAKRRPGLLFYVGSAGLLCHDAGRSRGGHRAPHRHSVDGRARDRAGGHRSGGLRGAC